MSQARRIPGLVAPPVDRSRSRIRELQAAIPKADQPKWSIKATAKFGDYNVPFWLETLTVVDRMVIF